MQQPSDFEAMLTGGHPNSLGNTVEVVDLVLADTDRLEELYQCYFSDDAVVRLRVSSAMKRICKASPALLVPYVDRLLDQISAIDQASTQWTLAQLFLILEGEMSAPQRSRATAILQRNLETSEDWIVLNTTMDTLSTWAQHDDELTAWLIPRLTACSRDTRRSVAARARRHLAALTSDKHQTT